MRDNKLTSLQLVSLFIFVGNFMFFGRTTELKKLNNLHQSDKFEFAIVYGRRRVGKTALIKEFCKNKKSIYFLSREASGETNLKNFNKDVYKTTNENVVNTSVFTDWEVVFEYIYKISINERIVLVIDEYPYLANGFNPISSILQAHIDENFKNSKLFLILCGSSMSFMENQVLGYKSPLYGRRTAQFKIFPFDFFESRQFLKGFGAVDQSILYSVTGGIPEYLNQINENLSVKSNIIDLFLTPSGYFYEEPTNLIKQELREPSTYNGIIEAIANGASRLNKIALKSGNLETNKCSKYLRCLIDLGIVKKEIPVTESVSKKSIYILDDQLFRFWYRFVFPNMSNIVSGLGSQLYDSEIEPNLSSYMGLAFEQICKQYFFELMRKNELPFFIGKMGRWWGNDPNQKCEVEIDILTFKNKDAIFAECKWTNEKTDLKILENLILKSNIFKYKNNYFYLFSKSGFTKAVLDRAEENKNIKLFTFEDINKLVI
ncbi:MAG: ATP-binding protein [Firmicutes bacterium]|nr:ATP-binding protein [Bacillota bacterium]